MRYTLQNLVMHLFTNSTRNFILSTTFFVCIYMYNIIVMVVLAKNGNLTAPVMEGTASSVCSPWKPFSDSLSSPGDGSRLTHGCCCFCFFFFLADLAAGRRREGEGKGAKGGGGREREKGLKKKQQH